MQSCRPEILSRRQRPISVTSICSNCSLQSTTSMSSIRSNPRRSSRSPNIPLTKEIIDIVENRLGDDFQTPEVSSEVVVSLDNTSFQQILEDSVDIELPPIPEKPLRFKKKQLEALLMGKINPTSKLLNRNNTKGLPIPISNNN